MKFIDLVNKRYTTKKYQAEKAIPSEKINQLKEILRMTPSSINGQPWKFTFITNEELKKKLAPFSLHNEHKVLDADLLVVFSAVDSVPLFEQHVRTNLPEGANIFYDKRIKIKSEDEIKVWMSRQVYIALGFLLAAAESMELDSTPMEGIETEKYDEILGLKDYKTLFAVTVGYRDPEDFNQPSKTPKSRLPLEDVIVSFS